MVKVAGWLNKTLINMGEEVYYGTKGNVYYLDFGFSVRPRGG
jgi:hypothetical protein